MDKISTQEIDQVRGNYIYVCISLNDARTTAIWEAYPVPEEAIKGMYAAVRRPKFTVDIVDNLGDPITSGTYNAPVPYSIVRDRVIPCFVFPILYDRGDLDSFYARYNIVPGGDKASYNLSFDVSPDEFKRMKNVVTRIDK